MPREFHTWPHTARKIVKESLREFVGDGEGEDYEVLTTFINEVQAEALRAAAEEIDRLYFGPDQDKPFSTGARHKWGAMQAAERVRARADRLAAEGGADRG